MSRLLNYFLKGLAFVVPLAVTIYVCVAIFRTIDGWLGLPIPGAGFVVTIALITAAGFFASGLVARGVLGIVERMLNRLPLVRLVYSSTRDLIDAFVGEKRRFDKPVLVSLSPMSNVRAIGFVTLESVGRLGAAGSVVVYLPQSYGFAGNLVVVPADQVSRIDADASDVMAFIISGGVTEIGQPRSSGK